MESHSLSTRQRLGEILVKRGICGIADVRDACGRARAANHRLGTVLIEAGRINEHDLVSALAEQYHSLPLFSLSGHLLSPSARKILSLETALLQKTLLFDLTENSMSMASPDPAVSDLFKTMLVAGRYFLTPYVVPPTLFMLAVIMTYQGAGPAETVHPVAYDYKAMTVIPDSVRKAVMRYLVRFSKTLVFENGRFFIKDGKVGLHTQGMVDVAWMLGAITLSVDGAVAICGEALPFRYDTSRLRRKIEDILRKNVSSRDVIRLAVILGADID